MDVIRSALQRLLGQDKTLSPLAFGVTNVTQQESDQAQQKESQRILQEVKKRNPNVGLSDRFILEQAQKHGDTLLSDPSQLPIPSPTNRPLKQVLGLQAQAEEAQPTAIDGAVESFLNKNVFPVTDRYGIPRAVAAGQFAAEGRMSGLGADRNNYYNIAAFDSNPDAAVRYNSPQEGVEAYAKFVTGNADNYASPQVKQKFIEAAKRMSNPEQYIRGIEQAGYAGDPNTYQKRAKNGQKSYESFIESTPEYQYYLKKAASKL